MTAELFDAVLAGDPATACALLQGGVDCNGRNGEGVTALMLAAGAGDLEMVRLLVGAGASVDATDLQGWSALTKAVCNPVLNRGFPEVVQTLIGAGADIEACIGYAVRPLMLAAGYGEAGVVEVLLAAGADVRAENEGGRTARMMAEAKDYVEVVNLLYQAELSLGDNRRGACQTGAASEVKVVSFMRKPGRTDIG